nr:hypothetical protein Iba_chr15aCG3260 [Ipomoea batatas]
MVASISMAVAMVVGATVLSKSLTHSATFGSMTWNDVRTFLHYFHASLMLFPLEFGVLVGSDNWIGVHDWRLKVSRVADERYSVHNSAGRLVDDDDWGHSSGGDLTAATASASD